MSCQRHRLSLVAKSRQCLQLFSRFLPASSCVDPIRCGVEIYICPAAGSVNVHSRLTVVANAFTERFLSHTSIVTFASHIRSSCRLFRLWYLTCCEQNPVLRLVVYLWCELSSITGQACRQFFTRCNVYLQKGSKLPFFKYHRFVRPPDFLALVDISCPKSLRGLVGD